MDTKLQVLNELLTDKENVNYKGPQSLFKYSPFDKHTFDMLENDYLFLCKAKNLDDKSECMSSLDLDMFYDLETNSLKRDCIEEIMKMIKPYTSIENYEKASNFIHMIMNKDGTIQPNFLIDYAPELQNDILDVDISPIINLFTDLPNKLNDENIKLQMEELIKMAINAKEKIGICSLTEHKDNEWMWNNYADKSTGYCVEYDFGNSNLKQKLYPVIYEDNRETNIILKIAGNFIGQLLRTFSQNKIESDISQFLRLFLTKDTIWSYQNEWRLIGEANGIVKSAPKVKAIYLGKNVSNENRLKMEEYCKNNNINLVQL